MSCKREAILLAMAGMMIPLGAYNVADATEMRFHPVAATGSVICTPGEGACGDTQIILSEGGVTVTLFL